MIGCIGYRPFLHLFDHVCQLKDRDLGESHDRYAAYTFIQDLKLISAKGWIRTIGHQGHMVLMNKQSLITTKSLSITSIPHQDKGKGSTERV